MSALYKVPPLLFYPACTGRATYPRSVADEFSLPSTPIIYPVFIKDKQ